MLDNAVEALDERSGQGGEKYIFLRFAYTPAGLSIICENPLLGVRPVAEKHSFFSTKTEEGHHLGISIMERIVHDAGGQFNIILSDDDLFQILILIPWRKEDAKFAPKQDLS